MYLGILCFISSHCAQAISVHGQTVCCLTYHLQSRPMSRYTREYGRTSSWYNKELAPHSKHHTQNSYSGWNKWALAATLLNIRQGSTCGRRASRVTRPRPAKLQLKLDGTEGVEGVTQAPKASTRQMRT